jgi:muramoyltetrapeptide carboxypeptidase
MAQQPRTIELIAPSGYPDNEDAVQRAIDRLTAEGHRIEGIEAVARRFQRFGGTDGERAAELNRLADPSRELPDIVLAVRGGYGATRILHGLDYDGLQRRLSDAPVALVGHSDFTAIQLALLARAGLTTFGGPMLASTLGAEQQSEFTTAHFWEALTSPQFTVTAAEPQAHDVDLYGTLWGGNLAIIASLIGSPYMPRIEGGILFIEDVNEHPFRVERMLYQLHFAGILARQQALVIGDFSGIRLSDYDNGYDFDAMIDQMRAVTGLPIVTGLRFGHIDDLLTLPVGANARLQVDRDGFALTVSGHPYLE